MKKIMKFTIPAITAFGLFIGATAQADCTGLLEMQIYKYQNAFAEQLTTAGGIGGAGVAEFPPAAIAAVVSSVGVSTHKSLKISQASKALRVISEAEVGDGLLIRELANKTYIEPRVLAATIKDANRRKIFCANEEAIYNYDQIVKFVMELKR